MSGTAYNLLEDGLGRVGEQPTELLRFVFNVVQTGNWPTVNTPYKQTD